MPRFNNINLYQIRLKAKLSLPKNYKIFERLEVPPPTFIAPPPQLQIFCYAPDSDTDLYRDISKYSNVSSMWERITEVISFRKHIEESAGFKSLLSYWSKNNFTQYLHV